jgi:hypothetical protein
MAKRLLLSVLGAARGGVVPFAIAAVVVVCAISLSIAAGLAHHQPKDGALAGPSQPQSAPIPSGIVARRARPTWVGDFHAGKLGRWQILPLRDALPGRIIVVRRVPDHQARFAGKFMILPNDPSPAPQDPTAQRAEVRATQAESDGFQGADVWYGWSVFFPARGFTDPAQNPNRASPGTTFTQWKRVGGECGSPNTVFKVDDWQQPGLYIEVHGGVNAYDDGITHTCPGTIHTSYRLADFVASRWYSFVFHVKWSSNPRIGFVEVWMNGKLVLPKLHHATLYRDWNTTTDYGVYLRQGILRTYSPRNGSYLYIDGTRVGHSYAAVAPAAFLKHR